jgi:hypothetical protein
VDTVTVTFMVEVTFDLLESDMEGIEIEEATEEAGLMVQEYIENMGEGLQTSYNSEIARRIRLNEVKVEEIR